MLAPATATPYERWRTQEVIWIINPEEFAAFGRLRTDEERQMFIEQFWLRRDPTPATQSNEFKEEHYRRIAWANDRFAYPGWDGWMSDRGMIYIKFGPPDEKEEHAADPSSYSYEKWRYRYLEGIGNDQTVAFVDQKGDGAYRLSIETDKKLAILGELGGPGRAIEVLKSISDRADVLFK